MTAILNFTLPNLDVPAGKAAASDASSSELRLAASQSATTGNQGVADHGNGKEFGKLLSDRIVKKETGKEGNFDGAGQSDNEPVAESAETLVAAAKSSDAAQPTANPPGTTRQAIELKLTADPKLINTELAKIGTKDNPANSEAALKSVPIITDTKPLHPAEKSAMTRLAGEQIALARSTARGPIQATGPAGNQPAPIALQKADPAADALGKVSFDSGSSDSSDSEGGQREIGIREGIQRENSQRQSGQRIGSTEAGLRLGSAQSNSIIGKSIPAGNQKPVTNQAVSEDPVTQARVTAPVPSDDLPTTISLNAEKSAASQSPKGLAPAVEAEELIAEQVRQQRPVAPDAANRTDRPVTGSRADVAVPSGNSEAEFAALSGKEFPEGGKALPSVLTQTPAQYAAGLSGRAEFMTRSVGNGRQRSIGKEVGEVPGLATATAANSRLPLADVFGKVITQVQPTASTETGMHSQSNGSDSQATGLLAQAQAGVDRTGGARTSQLTGLDPNNTFSLQLQPGSQEISAQLGSRIRWMGNLNISSAEMKLYPAELGTLEILITTEDDQARVNFITSTSAAKEMIEASLPRLRELLGLSGMFLEQGDVTHRDSSKSNSDSAMPVVEGPAVESLQTEALEQAMPMYQRSAGDHRIDHFA